ncbi:MAG: tail fiber domain-containing protein [Rhodospirillales bacterium]
MTTIKLKNGSGAPTAGDLAQGEPALDLTNKRLYTEDSGGTVIEVGTNPGVDVTFADNRKAVFGAGSDLQIYHDGSDSYIDDTGTGRLRLRGAADIILAHPTNGETYAVFSANGANTFYYDNAAKLATTSTGIDVTGTVTADGANIDGAVTTGDITIDNDDTPTLNFKKNSSADILGTINVSTDAGSGGKMVFQTKRDGSTALDRMTIDDNGNVGIGESSPSQSLHVNSGNTDEVALFESTDAQAKITFKDSTSSSTINTNNGNMVINCDSANAVADSFMAFRVDNNEKMRLDADGKLLISTTTFNPAASNVAGHSLRETGAVEHSSSSGQTLRLNRVNGDGVITQFRNAGTTVGEISITASATSYNTSSDYRLKENVVAMTGATIRLKQLAPKRFNFIADANATVDGFLAHEVADVVPEAVSGAKDAVDDDGNAIHQGIDQAKLVPLLVATIQELEARITALESN